MTVQEFLDRTDDKELIEMCKECEMWVQTGICPNGKFEALYNRVETFCCDKRDLEDYVLREALNRFKDIVPILLKRYPKEFVK